MNKLKLTFAVSSGLIMYSCILMSIKINESSYLGDYLLNKFSIQNNRIVIIIVFFVCFWIQNKLLKDTESILINWMRVLLTGLMFIAFVSYFIF
ncbi:MULTISPECIES: hypothetical protein [Bacillus]|uniref:hypothetical protein n=1 Tax=Bacillus TaxID=1386 RepID=UPI000BEDEC60|nr:hypothetical protein [Bacillus thuringiensis]EKS8366755.1 hypothetical protein [Bacillus cereus]EKS8373432.1 hypothetical protein [Bacillus cereus]MBG9496733.1 hypothetical protein [Bacillus thuringiensis]MBG9503530.1 hypothetical protein [Bacillus thuringiensis]MBG9508267.1 hypothetical protein [Bacillus thuringiensis]